MSSFQDLARCLEVLASNHAEAPLRKVFSHLNTGNPNLVLCSDAEMNDSAISFYMHDHDKRLPTLDEVLICQNETPLEQISLICRRAFSDNSGKLFIVMHAERIKYEAGLQLEHLIKNTTVTNQEYRLIFMASKEHNDSSYIVTAFDKYRIQLAAPPPSLTISKYLLQHLKSQVATDPDEVRVRIVKSRQSGNGKSLVVRRLTEQIPNHERRILQLHDHEVSHEKIISAWLKQQHSMVLHLDVTPAVAQGRSELIFSLSVLGGLIDSSGQVWLTPRGVYVIVELTTSRQVIKKVSIAF